MKILIKEKLSPHKFRDNSGYLICKDSILARTGSQQYMPEEVGLDSAEVGDVSVIDIDRPENEVFNEATLASFENKALTIDHPQESVNPDNHKELSFGFVRDVHRGKTENGEDVMLGTLVVTDAEAIEKIESGEMTDLSCGYDCDILKDDNGKYYQANIRGNHVALCEEGRAGIARIVDSKKVKDSLQEFEFKFKDLELNMNFDETVKANNLEEAILKFGSKKIGTHYILVIDIRNETRNATYVHVTKRLDELLREAKSGKFTSYDSCKDGRPASTQRRQFRPSDIDEEDSWLGTTEWATPKGSMYVYKKDGKIVCEAKGVAYDEPKGTFTFKTLSEFNRWLLDGATYDSVKDSKYLYTKKDIDEMDNLDELYMLESRIEEGKYEDNEIEPGLLKYISQKITKLEVGDSKPVKDKISNEDFDYAEEILEQEKVDWDSANWGTQHFIFKSEDEAKKAERILNKKGFSAKFKTHTNSRGHKTIFVALDSKPIKDSIYSAENVKECVEEYRENADGYDGITDFVEINYPMHSSEDKKKLIKEMKKYMKDSRRIKDTDSKGGSDMKDGFEKLTIKQIKANDAAQYIYLYPADDMTPRDIAEMKKYGLKVVGKNNFEGEKNLVVQGALSDLKKYNDEYLLGYDMHPDYLYKANEFAGDITDSKKIKDTLIPPTKECLKEVENTFKKLGWKIERSGQTMLGNKHYQIRTVKKDFNEDTVGYEFDELDMALEDINDKYHCEPTCCVNLMSDGSLTAGVDIREMYVKDSKPKNIDRIVKLFKQAKLAQSQLTKDANPENVFIVKVNGKWKVFGGSNRAKAEEDSRYVELVKKYGKENIKFVPNEDLDKIVDSCKDECKDSKKVKDSLKFVFHLFPDDEDDAELLEKGKQLGAKFEKQGKVVHMIVESKAAQKITGLQESKLIEIAENPMTQLHIFGDSKKKLKDSDVDYKIDNYLKVNGWKIEDKKVLTTQSGTSTHYLVSKKIPNSFESDDVIKLTQFVQFEAKKNNLKYLDGVSREDNNNINYVSFALVNKSTPKLTTKENFQNKFKKFGL